MCSTCSTRSWCRWKKELNFAGDYLALQKIRFEEGLQYHINVNKDVKGNLPPLSLQMLLENAIKHNVVSKQNPLHIEIKTENDTLVVENNAQPKSSPPEESTGIGLANISKRYELLSERNVTVFREGGRFVVKLPVLMIE